MRTRIIAWLILAWTLDGVEIQSQPVAVGMYSVPLEPGLNLAGLHLDYGNDHSISNLFREVPEGTELYQLADGSFTTNVYRAGAWERPTDTLALGEGAYVYNPTEETYPHAFGAEIPTGRLTNFIPAGLSIRASMVPRGGRLTQELGLTLNAFDNVYLLEGGALKVFTYLPDGTWRPSEPAVRLSEAFLINAARPTNWVVELEMAETLAVQMEQAGAPVERLDAVGTVNFANGAQGVDAPVRMAANNEKVSGPDWEAELLYLAGSNFMPVARVAFETNGMAGYFFCGSVEIEGSAPGEEASFKIRIWNQGENVGESEVLSVILGGGKVQPANLTGLQTRSVSEGVRLSIGRSGSEVVLSWGKEFGELNAESSVDLTNNWQPVNGLKTTNETSVILPLIMDAERMFFRLQK